MENAGEPTSEKGQWYLFAHQVPPAPLYFRARVLRQLTQVGAVAVKKSIYVVPADEETLEDLRAGREPFPKILEAAMQTPEAGVFVLRAIFEPRPLYQLLASKGFESWPERLAEDDWKVYFRRKPERRGGCGGHGH